MNVRKSMVLGLCVLATTAVSAKTSLSTDSEKLSYTIGADLGKNFKAQDISINQGAFIEGLTNALEGKTLQMTDDEMKQTLKAFQQKIMAKRMAEYQQKSEQNKKDGEAFLAANKKKDGVKTTASGLQYKVIAAGSGSMPTKEDTVVVEYTGKLLNGKVFDSSKGRKEPTSFKLTQVIPGWTEVLQMMKEGDNWEVVIPSDRAYGARGGMGGPIGPNETLIFDIHLISVKKDAKMTEANKSAS
jgi:FKBP-type peptidyl-prolyl cis-trans isomerase FklB